MNNLAFDEPVVLQDHEAKSVRTVEQAADILRSHLQAQFTITALNTLLVLERASEGTEIEEARQAFCAWVSHHRFIPLA